MCLAWAAKFSLKFILVSLCWSLALLSNSLQLLSNFQMPYTLCYTSSRAACCLHRLWSVPQPYSCHPSLRVLRPLGQTQDYGAPSPSEVLSRELRLNTPLHNPYFYKLLPLAFTCSCSNYNENDFVTGFCTHKNIPTQTIAKIRLLPSQCFKYKQKISQG